MSTTYPQANGKAAIRTIPKRTEAGRAGGDKPADKLARAIRAAGGTVAGPDKVGQFLAQCPAHKDPLASLAIRTAEDGTVVLKCFEGCEPAAVLDAVNLSWADLSPGERNGQVEAAEGWNPDDPYQPGDSWEPEVETPDADPDADNPLITNAVDSAAFAAMTFADDWIIDDILVAHEPLVVAGPSKSLKTGIAALDAAVSVASGRPFLGKFRVPRPRPVYVISAESGRRTLQRKFLDVCRAKGVNPADLPIHWYTDVEILSGVEGCHRLERAVRRYGAGFVPLDPSYLLLGGDVTSESAGNMFAMGRLLANVGMACLRAGATPAILTHANGRLQTGRPMELSDIAWSGFQQWARQWWLISRRSEYGDDGRHELYFRYGGSAGHTGLLSLDINEGTREDGRKWEVDVQTQREARQTRQAERDEEAYRELQADCDTVLATVVKVLNEKTTVATKTAIGERVGIGKRRLSVAADKLVADGSLVWDTGTIPCNTGTRSQYGLRRPDGCGTNERHPEHPASGCLSGCLGVPDQGRTTPHPDAPM